MSGFSATISPECLPRVSFTTRYNHPHSGEVIETPVTIGLDRENLTIRDGRIVRAGALPVEGLHLLDLSTILPESPPIRVYSYRASTYKNVLSQYCARFPDGLSDAPGTRRVFIGVFDQGAFIIASRELVNERAGLCRMNSVEGSDNGQLSHPKKLNNLD